MTYTIKTPRWRMHYCLVIVSLCAISMNLSASRLFGMLPITHTLPLTIQDTILLVKNEPVTKEYSAFEAVIPRYDEQRRIISQNYKSSLRNMLNNYFPASAYFICVDVKLEKQLQEPDTDEYIVDMHLPGIPYLQGNIFRREQSGRFINDKTPGGGNIDHLLVNIYVDTLFANDEINFLRKLVSMNLNLFPDRGDELNIEQMVFPRSALYKLDVTGTGDVSDISLPAETNDMQHAEMVEHEVDQTATKPLLWFVLLGAIVLLSLFLIYIIILFSKARSQPAKEYPAHATVAPIQVATSTHAGISANGQQNGVLADSAKDMSFLAGLFIEDAMGLGCLFESWMQQDEAVGAGKAAKLINLVDARFVVTLKNHMSPNNYKLLEQAMANPANHAISVDAQGVAQIANELRLTLTPGSTGNMPEFKHLAYISKSLLLQIFNTLSVAEKSLLVKCLPHKRGAWLLNQLDSESVANILGLTLSMNGQSYLQLRHTSQKTFNMMVELMANENKNDKMIKHIMHVVDALPVMKQDELLIRIEAHDHHLYKKLHQEFVSWNSLMGLDDQTLKAGIDSLDSKSLATALHNTDKKFVGRMLALRPAREQTLLKELMLATAIEKEQTVEEARKKLLMSVKHYLSTKNAHCHGD